MQRKQAFLLLLLALLFLFAATPVQAKYEEFSHIIVIVLENWSYNGLFGFIGNNGIPQASQVSKTQLDRNNAPYTTLPMTQPGIPQDLPNEPFDLARFINVTTYTIDLTHSFYTEQAQINNGLMNKFVTFSSAKGLTMSYYDARSLYLGQLALNYTTFDRWHHAAFGGSFLNHQWLITVEPPVFPDAPASIINQLNPDGTLQNPDVPEKQVTPDFYAVNTIQPYYQPYRSPVNRLPPQNGTTIGCRLTDAGVSWKWYSGGWNDANAGNPDPTFQYHHQPFNYYTKYGPGMPGRANLQDEVDLLKDLKNPAQMPKVSFYKPLGKYNYHPDYSIVGGEAEVKLKEIIDAIQASSIWPTTAVFVTFDEHGGRADSVAPPVVDRWGPGSRIPTILVSPLAKKGFIDSTVRDSTNIMKMIEDRFNLKPLGVRDAQQPTFDNVVLTPYIQWYYIMAIVISFVLISALLIIAVISVGVIAVKRKQLKYEHLDEGNTDSSTAKYYSA